MQRTETISTNTQNQHHQHILQHQAINNNDQHKKNIYTVYMQACALHDLLGSFFKDHESHGDFFVIKTYPFFTELSIAYDNFIPY